MTENVLERFLGKKNWIYVFSFLEFYDLLSLVYSFLRLKK
ncbi:hypothetical protein LEP1GSC081_0074 [Leptospira kirschneri str. H1]|uniref:Uncharacterized protein n=1 Tax=Leptospira kirschneri str. H1 TaxID=1049966 RepID=A0A0E2B936_9LEPT|nr:hypothetical protein LEP1GSC081_0074 [Leptospira kirschneri str. H1]